LASVICDQGVMTSFSRVPLGVVLPPTGKRRLDPVELTDVCHLQSNWPVELDT
jgi:hypothetical protein